MVSCIDCTRIVGPKNKSGRCRSCLAKHLNSDPAIHAKRVASIRALELCPAHREKKRAATTAGIRRKMRDDPEFAEHRKELGRQLGKSGAYHAKYPAGSEPRRKAAKSISETKMAWCPEEYREEYRRIIRNGYATKAEAQAMIFEEIARKEASMTPFERQMEALRNGARLIEKPDLRKKTGYDFTLGGITDLGAAA